MVPHLPSGVAVTNHVTYPKSSVSSTPQQGTTAALAAQPAPRRSQSVEPVTPEPARTAPSPLPGHPSNFETSLHPRKSRAIHRFGNCWRMRCLSLSCCPWGSRRPPPPPFPMWPLAPMRSAPFKLFLLSDQALSWPASGLEPLLRDAVHSSMWKATVQPL